MFNKLLIGLMLVASTSIYTVHFTTIDGNDHSFSLYEGKKVLIVNIATGASRVDQLAGLEQLYQQYHDSLVVIGFPSNSFGHESRSNAEIQAFCESQYGVSFPLSGKVDVKGENMASIYQWFAHSSENGVMDAAVIGDFQKFLVDKNGALIGVFSPLISPMDSTIQNAITGN